MTIPDGNRTPVGSSTRRRRWLVVLLEGAASLAPIDVDPSTELRGALAAAGVPVRAETYVSAGYGLGIVAGVAWLFAMALLGVPGTVGGPFAIVVAFAVAHLVHELPSTHAAVARRRALGRAPDLVARLSLRLHVEPALEPAVAFATASRNGTRGPLATALTTTARRTGRLDHALVAFADDYSADAPGLRRACHLLATASDAPRGTRSRRIDRAFSAVLDGTRDRLRAYTSGLSGPINALYAFGVLLPLALVAVLPAAGAAGLPISLGVIVVIYDVVLPVVLLVATAWVVANRPVAFPPPRVPRTHPAIPARRWPALGVGLAAGGCAGVGLVLLGRVVLPGGVVPAWAGAVLGVAVGSGVAAHRFSAPAGAVRDRALAIEDGLVDAVYAVGRRVANGDALEDALAAGADVPGATGDAFADAVGVQRRLGVSTRAAFLGEYGALADVPSRRVHAVVDLLALAAAEGAPAGDAVVAVADHLEDLRAVERACRDELATVTDTLRSTGRVFGPLVGGTTVALADGLASPQALLGDAPGPGIDTAALGLAVGAYVLGLAAILALLAVVVESGFDRAALGRELGTALPLAGVAFTGGLVLTNAMI